MIRFVATALLAVVAPLAGCASAGAGTPSGQAVSIGAPVTLSVGQSVALPDHSSLTYTGVLNDSRCPPKVACIQAGSAAVGFRHVAGSVDHAVTLDTPRAPTADLGAYRLTLVSLDFGPSPNARVQVDGAGG